MKAAFLIGPAGSGKTHRCLEEIRSELRRSAEGPPLILLAPKQATYQLERQLLETPGLAGYTRLQVLSFERLGSHVLSELGRHLPDALSEEGRLMALRAILMRCGEKLEIFRSTARLPGFASQINLLIREFQRHRYSSRNLAGLADRFPDADPLGRKLRDLSVILDALDEWHRAHDLVDANCLLDLAAQALEETKAPLRIAGLWMDGFAEMTPQEIGFLGALIPCCDRSLLAFCLQSRESSGPLDMQAVVEGSFKKCYARIQQIEGCETVVERLPSSLGNAASGPAELPPRFRDNPVLGHLESHWNHPRPFERSNEAAIGETLRIHSCPDREAEVALAAKSIWRHVRRDKGRFRETAVIVRNLEDYHDAVQRVFHRYEIPYFLDRRESIAHHPMAELTRCALRALAFGWKQGDWFGALKTGLAAREESLVDAFENEALSRGWEGAAFLRELPGSNNQSFLRTLDAFRQKTVEPFVRLRRDLLSTPALAKTGGGGAESSPADRMAGQAVDAATLAESLRRFWKRLDVESQLQAWSLETFDLDFLRDANRIHGAAWTQMNDWLDNLERAFESDAMTLAEWLPVMEAALSQLTVGVIPPSIDQVLVGAIDRTRNPKLKFVAALGFNEGVFPAPPSPNPLLNDRERQSLELQDVHFGPYGWDQRAQERYLAYIALTRSSGKLLITCANQDSNQSPLNPSPFLSTLKQLFPDLPFESPTPLSDEPPAHPHDLKRFYLELLNQNTEPDISRLPESSRAFFQSLRNQWSQQSALSSQAPLPRETVEALYGEELKASVSSLEDFASCPFKFFAGRGLRAEERREFEIDPRERGTFQHMILDQFHLALARENKRWRDVSPREASELAGEIGRRLIVEYQDGLFDVSERRRFQAELLIESTQSLVEAMVGWMDQYRLDPNRVELEFGLSDKDLPGWIIQLDDRRSLLLRGRIDRLDLSLPEEPDEAAVAVVIDYKSRHHQLDEVKVRNGLQLQLLAYLGLLRRLEDPQLYFPASAIIPAGVFYVNMRGRDAASAQTREEAVPETETLRARYQHFGRFNLRYLERLDDRSDCSAGDQFRYRFKKNSREPAFGKKANDGCEPEEFEALLDGLEQQLISQGLRVYEGEIEVSPYGLKKETACDYCRYREICRFDPWTMPFRRLE